MRPKPERSQGDEAQQALDVLTESIAERLAERVADEVSQSIKSDMQSLLARQEGVEQQLHDLLDQIDFGQRYIELQEGAHNDLRAIFRDRVAQELMHVRDETIRFRRETDIAQVSDSFLAQQDQGLAQVLRLMGYEEIEGIRAGDEFDPHWHEMLDEIPVSAPNRHERIRAVRRPGYVASGSVARPVGVAVYVHREGFASNSTQEEDLNE